MTPTRSLQDRSDRTAPGTARRLALLVDDDADFRASVAALVAREGFETLEASSLAEARALLREQRADIMFIDLVLPDGNGLDLMDDEPSGPSRPDVVIITGNSTVESAVGALRSGVLDYLGKPVDRNRLRAILANAERTQVLRGEVGGLRGQLRELGRFGPMVGRSAAMQRVFDLIERVGPTRATVMILGESGTGKELVAETVHRMSPRARARFLAVNCGAVAPNVIESELFGHEKGSFTGAERIRRGYFEEANGGTLFLDEITEMSPELQVKLLRVLETGTIMRVGASESVPVDVRLVAASNRSPEEAMREGRLREDLYYRLNVFPIEIPPLRERLEDIEMLAQHFLEAYGARENSRKQWTPQALRRLKGHHWPGNVRELRNVTERAAIMAEEVITELNLPGADTPVAAPVLTTDGIVMVAIGSPLADVEHTLICAAMQRYQGDKRRVAQQLGISLKTLYNRLNVYEASGRPATASRG